MLNDFHYRIQYFQLSFFTERLASLFEMLNVTAYLY